MILFSFFLVSCGVRDLLYPPSGEERYYEGLDSPGQFVWDSLKMLSFSDAAEITTPYREIYVLDSLLPVAAGYRTKCKEGEVLRIQLNTVSVFVEIYKSDRDTTRRMLYQTENANRLHELEIRHRETYFIRIQPMQKLHFDFPVEVSTIPVYEFPVAGGKLRDIGSFWGIPRDGARRKYQGIDIVARKGTPLLAVPDAEISSVKHRGLSDKQIWFSDNLRNQTVYYAHLDSQFVTAGQNVNRGDNIGTVGNTRKTRTTPPHLHIGIYKSRSGAIDRINFVQTKDIRFSDVHPTGYTSGARMTVVVHDANFRISLNNRPKVRSTLPKETDVTLIGATTKWFHVRPSMGDTGFIFHTSLTCKTTKTDSAPS